MHRMNFVTLYKEPYNLQQMCKIIWRTQHRGKSYIEGQHWHLMHLIDQIRLADHLHLFSLITVIMNIMKYSDYEYYSLDNSQKI